MTSYSSYTRHPRASSGIVSPPLLKATARVASQYLRLISSSLDVRLRDVSSAEGPNEPLAFIWSTTPALLTFWNAHSLLILAAQHSCPHLSRATGVVAAVADDSVGGLLTHHIFRFLGIKGQMLSVTSEERRLQDLRSIMTRRPHLAIAADSHGPYRDVNAGLARLVRSYEGNVRPVSAWANRSIPIFRRIRMAVPLPKTTIVVTVGAPPARADVTLPTKDLAARLRELLLDLEITRERPPPAATLCTTSH